MKNLLRLKYTFIVGFFGLLAASGLSQSTDTISEADAYGRARIDYLVPLVSGVQLQTPDSSAKGLFSAWQENDKISAAKYATKKAIDYLFDLSNSKDKYEFENCSKYGGAVHCWYRNNDGGSLNLTMIRTGKSWKVNSMEFVDIS